MGFRTVIIALALAAINAASAADGRVVCYYSSWAVYRTGPGKFEVSNIDPTLCTHIVYAFSGIDTTGEIILLDPWNDAGDEWHEGQFQQFAGLKDKNPDVKLMLAVGGYTFGPQNFQTTVRDPTKRANFVKTSTALLKEYKFDGLDIDWEYSDGVGGTPADKTGLSSLLSELRTEFNKTGLLLSIATPANLNLVANCYELDKISETVDFINIMSYDFHGSWEAKTGHATPLYAESNSVLSVEAVLNFYIANGTDPSKINLGLVTYGRTWTLQNATSNGVGAAASGPGTMGLVVPEAGIMAYAEICDNDWPETWDKEQGVPYATKENQWVSYDDDSSIIVKMTFAKSLGVTGVMVWSLETEDHTGNCSGQTYPLLRAIKAFNSK